MLGKKLLFCTGYPEPAGLAGNSKSDSNDFMFVMIDRTRKLSDYRACCAPFGPWQQRGIPRGVSGMELPLLRNHQEG